jgi:hypothetical protein
VVVCLRLCFHILVSLTLLFPCLCSSEIFFFVKSILSRLAVKFLEHGCGRGVLLAYFQLFCLVLKLQNRIALIIYIINTLRQSAVSSTEATDTAATALQIHITTLLSHKLPIKI